MIVLLASYFEITLCSKEIQQIIWFWFPKYVGSTTADIYKRYIKT